MRRRFLLLSFIVLAAGCAMTIQEEETLPARSYERPVFEAEKPIPFERFLVLMDGSERQVFFDLRTRSARERFLQERGITVKRMLADNLRLGMRAAEVQDLLGRPQVEAKEEHATRDATVYNRVVDEWWVYQDPASGNLVFIPFRNGWVVDWLLDPGVRDMVHQRPKTQEEREIKHGKLIHIGEKMPSLLRKPEEEKEAYVARMRQVAPILFSAGPPSWPEASPLRDGTTNLAKSRVNKQEVYSWWGSTSKLYEVPELEEPEYRFASNTRWTYRVFNGYGFTYYSLFFQNDRLTDWEVDTDVNR